MLGITPCKVNEMENPQFTSKALAAGGSQGQVALLSPSLQLVIHLSLVSSISLTPLWRDELACERPLACGLQGSYCYWCLN